MGSSSLVGMRSTLMVESSVLMMPATPRLFFAGSILTPMKPRPLITSAQASTSFSPMPAVKTIASAPPTATLYAPMYFCRR